MIRHNKEALICDLAETYHILNYRELSVELLATLSCGLRADSRIKMELNEQQCSTNTWLLAATVDYLALIRQSLVKGGKAPKLLTQQLCKSNDKVQAFSSVEAFEKERARLLKVGEQNGQC